MTEPTSQTEYELRPEVALSGLLDAAQFPKLTIRQRIYWKLRSILMFRQCKGQHMPYAHLTDEECNTFWIGRCENKKIYCCMRRRWHLGKCEDVHGRRW